MTHVRLIVLNKSLISNWSARSLRKNQKNLILGQSEVKKIIEYPNQRV